MARVGQSADSIDAEVFLQELHDALQHVRELPARRSHPLCRRLGRRSPISTTELHQLLLNTIEQVRPSPQVGPDAPRWRRYHYLRMRYVEGARLGQVITELGISERQARREHNAALQELAARLVQTVGGGQDISLHDGVAREEMTTRPTEGDTGAFTDRAAYLELEAELTPLESSVEIESMHLSSAVEDALSLIIPFAASRDVVVEYVPAETPSAIIATPTIVRQILLNALTYLVGFETTRRLRVTLAEQEATVDVRLVPVEYGETRGARASIPSLPLLTAARLSEGQEAVLQTEILPHGSTAIRLRFLTTSAPLVLIVDDNPSMIRLFRRYLRGADLRLVQARNGIHAEQLARALHPNTIVLDLMMPIQDGWDLFRSIRSHPETTSIPVIACSVLPERELALSLGANGFLAKPVSSEGLVAALGQHQILPRTRISEATNPDLP